MTFACWKFTIYTIRRCFATLREWIFVQLETFHLKFFSFVGKILQKFKSFHFELTGKTLKSLFISAAVGSSIAHHQLHDLLYYWYEFKFLCVINKMARNFRSYNRTSMKTRGGSRLLYRENLIDERKILNYRIEKCSCQYIECKNRRSFVL